MRLRSTRGFGSSKSALPSLSKALSVVFAIWLVYSVLEAFESLLEQHLRGNRLVNWQTNELSLNSRCVTISNIDDDTSSKEASYCNHGQHNNRYTNPVTLNNDHNNQALDKGSVCLLQCPSRDFPWLQRQFRRAKLLLWPLPIKWASAIRLLRLDTFPSQPQVGQVIKLRCIYETKGDRLQSLSWYKNGREFYRFQPSERRQVLAFNLTGVHVDIFKSKNTTVYLTNTTTETSGRYKCEATATNFQEVNMETLINVQAVSASSAASWLAQSVKRPLPSAMTILTLLILLF